MSAPVLGNRNCFYVNYVGTDDPGYNAIGAPWSYRTVGAALAALSLVANPPSETNPWFISVGPGVFTDADQELPPWVWIVGSPDGNGQQTILAMSFSLSADWSNPGNQSGGFSSVNCGSLDLTLPASGGGTRVVEVTNCQQDITSFTFEGQTTSDYLRFTNSGLGDPQNPSLGNAVIAGGVHIFQNVRMVASDVTIQDSANADAVIFLYGFYCVANIVIQATTTQIDVTLAGCSLENVTIQNNGGTINSLKTDAISLPAIANLSFSGGFTYGQIQRTTDAYPIRYTPAIPGNWSPTPATVQAALDQLAASTTPGLSANVQATASGTAYTLTAANAALVFGTTSPAIVLARAGTWLILATVVTLRNNTTLAVPSTLSFNLQRTNNTPAALINSDLNFAVGNSAGVTAGFAEFELPPTIYATANSNDAITIYGGLTVAPSGGSLQCTAPGTKIVAVWLGA